MAETHLSQTAYDRLKQELDDLTTRGRVDIAQTIERARELGDLKENADYHAAKEDQGRMEARIRQIQSLLDSAVIVDNSDDGTVANGSIVSLRYAGDDDVERFLFANRENATDEGGKVTLADGTTLDVYSPESPIGQAIRGARAGDTVVFGPRSLEVTVVSVEPYGG